MCLGDWGPKWRRVGVLSDVRTYLDDVGVKISFVLGYSLRTRVTWGVH